MVSFAIRLLEGMFVLGALGSALVLVLTTIDDVRELFGKHEREHDEEQQRHVAPPAAASQPKAAFR